MKILKVRFKNLNSLKGEWEIDFEELAKDGIFAITGATGSGKSTILDAITLALYAKTPREAEINEIMTKNSVECFAEVIFRGREGKKYLSRFEQWRAHKRLEGDIQPYSILLEEIGKKTITSNNKTEWRKKIEEVSGLNFDRFIRSMMLTQGKFALFLEAKNSAKSEILEQITGSAIYREISKKIHKKHKEKKDELELYKKRQNIEEFLNENEIKELEKLQIKLEKSIDTMKDNLTKIQENLNSFERVFRLENEIKDWSKELENLIKKKSESDYRKADFIVKTREKILSLKALESDNKIEKDYLKKIELEAMELADKNINNKTLLKKNIQELESLEEEVDSKENELQKFRESLKDLKILESQIDKKMEKLSSLDELVKVFESEIKEIENSLKKEKNFFEKMEKKINAKPLLESIKVSCIESLQDEKRELKIEENKLIFLRDMETLLKKSMDSINDTLEKIEDSEDEIILLEKSIKMIKLKILESKKNSLLENIEELQKEKKELEDAELKKRLNSLRRELKDGEPCPLCGALAHPWEGKNFELEQEKLNSLKSELESKKLEFLRVEDKISELDVNLASVQMPKDSLEVLEQKLDALKNKIEQKTVLEMEINELRLGEMEIKSSIQTLENLIRLKESLKEKKDKIDELEKQRKDIINELKFLEIKKGQFLRIDNLDEFENRSLKEIESLKESITYIKDETSLLEKNISQNIGAINSKNKEIRKLTQTIEEKDRRLQKEIEDNLKIKKEVFEKLKRVTDEQFENEKSFKDSIDQELIKINSTIQKHNTELQALNSKLRDLSKKELDIQKENLIQEMEKAQKSLGIEESKIKKAKKLREDYKHLENEIKILEDELALLSKLNDLIGSHDGSKFSNYAQALTMDYLLNLANSHLKVLNPRYRLIQKRTENIKERLGLMVIDTHFIDAKRGVATLSGGEKFVVSLALALGLSDLAGDKIKVETLFLDEGFGSLDPETLDIVLEVLDNLRAQNRVIGLISHIEMIKERVQNGIEVKIDASGIGYLNDRFRVNKK